MTSFTLHLDHPSLEAPIDEERCLLPDVALLSHVTEPTLGNTYTMSQSNSEETGGPVVHDIWEGGVHLQILN